MTKEYGDVPERLKPSDDVVHKRRTRVSYSARPKISRISSQSIIKASKTAVIPTITKVSTTITTVAHISKSEISVITP